MSARKKITAVLLSAALQAKELADYLVSFPDDYTVIASLRDEADAICRIARTLRIRELAVLANRFIDAVADDLSSREGIVKLNDTIAKILSIAKKLEPEKRSAPGLVTNPSMEIPTDPFSNMGGTRWVAL